VEIPAPRLGPKNLSMVDRRRSAANVFSSWAGAKIKTKYGPQMNADQRR
jgi:hypothetical protein